MFIKCTFSFDWIFSVITRLFPVCLEQRKQQNLLRQRKRGEFEMDSNKAMEIQKWVRKI